MNFEINKGKEKSNFELVVLVNGEEIGYAHSGSAEYGNYYVFIDKISNDFSQFNLQQVFNFDVVTISLNIDNNKYSNFDIFEKDSSLVLDKLEGHSLFLTIDILKWDKGVTILKFIKKLEEHLINNKNFDFKLEDNTDFKENGILIDISETIDSKNIGELYHEILGQFNFIIEVIFEELMNENSFVSKFTFPSEIQSSCEQYLIYFSNFLADLGINASTEIKSDAKNTLFTITPENEDEALSKIRDALNLYLNLPNIKDLEIISRSYTDISVQQLIANVYHLKSQLMMANSSIQLKDATIETLKINNYQITSLTNQELRKSNEEKIFGGVASVNEFEWKGFKLNIAEIFRRLKRRF